MKTFADADVDKTTVDRLLKYIHASKDSITTSAHTSDANFHQIPDPNIPDLSLGQFSVELIRQSAPGTFSPFSGRFIILELRSSRVMFTFANESWALYPSSSGYVSPVPGAGDSESMFAHHLYGPPEADSDNLSTIPKSRMI